MTSHSAPASDGLAARFARIDGGLLALGTFGQTNTQWAFYPNAVSTSSATGVSLGFPELDVIVGVSGEALVAVSSYVDITTTTTPTSIEIQVDGLPASVPWQGPNIAASGGVAMTVTGLSVIEGLVQGEHPFQLTFLSDGTNTVTWSDTYLAVTPL